MSCIYFLQRFSCRTRSRSCLRTTDFASYCIQIPQLIKLPEGEGVMYAFCIRMQNSENRGEAFPLGRVGFCKAVSPAVHLHRAPGRLTLVSERLHCTSQVPPVPSLGKDSELKVRFSVYVQQSINFKVLQKAIYKLHL